MKKFIGYAIVKKSRSNYVMGLFNEDRDSLLWAIDACGFKKCEVVEVYEENNKCFMKKEKDFIEL